MLIWSRKLPDIARHWLTDIARGARLPYAAQLRLPGRTLTPEARSTVRRICQVTDEALMFAVASHFRLHVADLAAADGRATRLVPEAVSRKYLMLPVRESDREIVIATANPVNADAERDVVASASRRPLFEIAAPAAILRRIGELYRPATAVESLLSAVSVQIATVEVVEANAPDKVSAQEIEAAPIVRLTNVILQDAVVKRASDILIEPGGRRQRRAVSRGRRGGDATCIRHSTRHLSPADVTPHARGAVPIGYLAMKSSEPFSTMRVSTRSWP